LARGRSRARVDSWPSFVKFGHSRTTEFSLAIHENALVL